MQLVAKLANTSSPTASLPTLPRKLASQSAPFSGQPPAALLLATTSPISPAQASTAARKILSRERFFALALNPPRNTVAGIGVPVLGSVALNGVGIPSNHSADL
jgi:hypothetical protein